jgi:hypothetical protein
MMRTTITHKTDDYEDPDTNIFYDKLVEIIDALTGKSNDTGRAVVLSYDEDMSSITLKLD